MVVARAQVTGWLVMAVIAGAVAARSPDPDEICDDVAGIVTQAAKASALVLLDAEVGQLAW